MPKTLSMIISGILVLVSIQTFAAFFRDMFQAVPAHKEPAPTAKLGQKLFFDPILSAGNKYSCNDCHQKNKAFSGFSNQQDVPTLLNVTYMYTFFWNGRALTLSEALEEHLLSPTLMGQEENTLIEALKSNPEYVSEFETAYENGIALSTVIDALASYLETLTTPYSRFDQYITGNVNAFNEKERTGFELFKSYGCASCHQGRNVGGNLMQKFGIYRNYFQNPSAYDLGLFQFTKNEEDRFVFRVPSLRNIALTAPYFHNGSAQTLADAIRIMGQYQLNREIPDQDVEKIEAFLQTLSGSMERLND
ncbi:MAG TPA: cytochrome c peroxidase [Gammaproteobacteria bacterium]|nr:cytochrome c peroxidase [Gammaproteobacteria bacterium]